MCARLGGIRSTSARLGVSESQLHRWIRGTNAPPAPAIFRLAELAGVSLEWVAHGDSRPQAVPMQDGTGSVAGAAAEEEREGPGAFVHVAPLEGADVSLGGPPGCSLVLRRHWTQSVLRVEPESLRYLYMEGESMAPTICPGDAIVMERRSLPGLGRDGIYVLRIKDTLLVKRLQCLEAGRIRVSTAGTRWPCASCCSFCLPWASSFTATMRMSG